MEAEMIVTKPALVCTKRLFRCGDAHATSLEMKGHYLGAMRF